MDPHTPLIQGPAEPLRWLRDTLPIWLSVGLERREGGFVENLSAKGDALPGARRCMVQARQIYSMRVAGELGVAGADETRAAIESGARLLTNKFSLPSGAFRHAIDEAGEPLDETPGLYGQAFALFGLAEAYSVLEDPALRNRALALVAYLRRERRAARGGYTELEQGREVFRSNPHMHLFEAALAWVERDADPAWRELAGELLALCLDRFIEPASGLLGENFTSEWEHERTADARFYWEPGHHCEWSWLLWRYETLVGGSLAAPRARLYDLAVRHGRDPRRANALIDQVWSDFRPKLRTARFWPQCERIKAAVRLGRSGDAHEGVTALFRYFAPSPRGLWFDTWEEDGCFRETPVKASSLYHIIGGLSEYVKAL
jgi:mannose/cellobiose epimerase-like protein (N-acyl-D-glucosamine 2-epimerase family)